MDDRTRADLPETDRTQWEPELNRLTKEHEGRLITIEVLDRTYGDLEEAERLPFAYADYDRKDDAVIIGVGGKSGAYPVVLRHMIPTPSKVVIDDRPESPALLVADSDGTTTLIAFLGRSA